MLMKATNVQGLILPLCQSGDCTLREAVIITSVLQRASIPVLHSAAALLHALSMLMTIANHAVLCRA